MIRIFLETSKNTTSEYNFIETLLTRAALSDYEIIPVGSKDNIGNLQNKFVENTIEGGKNLIIFDADTTKRGDGYENTKQRIAHETFDDGVTIDGIFLFPNNQDDGTFENLLEHLIPEGKHKVFLDCFSDYAKCLGTEYKTPGVKDKMYEYISLQKGLTKKLKNEIKRGHWLWDNPEYWNLDADYLNPLKDFLAQHFS